MKKILLLPLLFSFTCGHAQYAQPYFNSLTFQSGLPDGFVTTALQDKIGYIWIGTQNGLARYDGYKIKTYEMQDENGDVLASYYVSNLSEDGNGTIWVNLGREGLYWYNRQKDAFVKIHYPATKKDILKSEWFSQWVEDSRKGVYWLVHVRVGEKLEQLDMIDTARHTIETYSSLATGSHFIPLRVTSNFSLKKDLTGRLWLTTDSLLSLYDLKKGAFVPYSILPNNSRNVVFNDIFTNPFDVDILWFTTYLKNSPGGLNPNLPLVIRYNIKTGVYKKYSRDSLLPSSLGGACSVIITDTKKRLWFVTDKGMSLYNSQSQAFTNYTLPIPTLSNGVRGTILSAAAGSDGSLWVGGWFPGLFHINTANGDVKYIIHSDKDAGSLPDESYITKIFFDNAGILWGAAGSDGVIYINPRASVFNNIVTIPAGVKKLTGNGYISGVYNDSSFFVTGQRGLFNWNPYSNQCKQISLGDSLAEKNMQFFIKGLDGLLWMNCWGFGLYSYDPRTGTVKNYSNNPKDGSSITNNYITALAEGKDGTIWVAMSLKGICSLNRQNGKFTRYPFIDYGSGDAVAANALDDNTAL